MISSNGPCIDPFLFAKWERVLFLHFLISPEILRAHVPPAFELDLFEGHACISVVAVTMRDFRPCKFDPLALPFRCIREQRFLNFRTYVRWNREPGAFFLHGWLSQPAPVPLPSNILGLPYSFASSNYDHRYESGKISGIIRNGIHQFVYRGTLPSDATWQAAQPGSLAEFVMERYSGFFHRGKRDYVFRASHPLWLQQTVEASIEKDELITGKFPWWKEARFAGAAFAPGFDQVSLGKAHALPGTGHSIPKHRVLSRFFEMP
jgi:uncharacterized protein YqjF (DUF2071 family)